MWKPIATGTYLWLLTVQTDASDDTGVFQIMYDPGSVEFDFYEDSSNTPPGDFESEENRTTECRIIRYYISPGNGNNRRWNR